MLKVLKQFTITDFSIEPLGDGLINSTWLVHSDHKKFVLQKIKNLVCINLLFSCFNFLLIFGGLTNIFLLDDHYNFLFKYSRYPDDEITKQIVKVIIYAIFSCNALFYGYNLITKKNNNNMYLSWLNTFVKNKEFNINLLLLIGINE